MSARGTVTILDEGDTAVGEATTQAKRYGENPADFADQPRVSFRLDVERLTEHS